MDQKTVGIIATIVAVLFCGCPGFGLCLGGVLTLAGFGTWQADMPGVVNETGSVPAAVGIPVLCVGIIFLLIPVAVGFFTLRNKAEDAAAVNEPFSSE